MVGRIFQQTDEAFRGPEAGINSAQGWKGREALWLDRGGENEQQMRPRRWGHLVTQIKGSSVDSEIEEKTGSSKIHTMDLSSKF